MSAYTQVSPAAIEHPDVDRAERAFTWAKGLLAASVAGAVVAVATQVAQNWSEGHLLALWIALWVVAFAALALFATRRASHGLRSVLASWSAARRRRAADEQLWRAAMLDARVMADLSRAMSQAAERDVRSYP